MSGCRKKISLPLPPSEHPRTSSMPTSTRRQQLRRSGFYQSDSFLYSIANDKHTSMSLSPEEDKMKARRLRVSVVSTPEFQGEVEIVEEFSPTFVQAVVVDDNSGLEEYYNFHKGIVVDWLMIHVTRYF